MGLKGEGRRWREGPKGGKKKNGREERWKRKLKWWRKRITRNRINKWNSIIQTSGLFLEGRHLCERMRDFGRSNPLPGRYVPKCTKEGKFDSPQRRGSVLFCVDEETGIPDFKTGTQIGTGSPDCKKKGNTANWGEVIWETNYYLIVSRQCCAYSINFRTNHPNNLQI